MATQTSKAKRIEPLPRKPSVARAEIVDKATRGRFEAELDAALKRNPTSEVKLGGALRAVGACEDVAAHDWKDAEVKGQVALVGHVGPLFGTGAFQEQA